MNVLLIGGPGSLINNLILKTRKEGHKVYLLTGSRNEQLPYQKVFERYDFPYDSQSLFEIFESVRPDLTIFAGAYDTNFTWEKAEDDATAFMTAVSNIVLSNFRAKGKKLIFLSSEEVFGWSFDDDIREEEPTCPVSIKGVALDQAEKMVLSTKESLGMDSVIVRLGNMYHVPQKKAEVSSIIEKLCLQAICENKITYKDGETITTIYETDAIDCIGKIAFGDKHSTDIYHVVSDSMVTLKHLAEMVAGCFGNKVTCEAAKSLDDDGEPVEGYYRCVLDGSLYEEEFGEIRFCNLNTMIKRICATMQRHPYNFTEDDEDQILIVRMQKQAGWLFQAAVPFVENIIAFIPTYYLNYIAQSSRYFAKIDLYLIYTLIFALVHGQNQAVFSAMLSLLGYLYLAFSTSSITDLLLDSATYIWVATLFGLGLSTGYLHDRIRTMKDERQEEKEFLALQLDDIKLINNTNVRIKDALQAEIVNQNDSIGKIYKVTSGLDQYSPEEVLFYAAEMVAMLMNAEDVAIYNVSNSDYARLFSSTTRKARSLGPSIKYSAMGDFYTTLMEQKVFINRTMDERYPLMADAIFNGDKMEMLILVWGISWNNMTLGQANRLHVVSALIQNATIKANRYMEALAYERYIPGTRMLEPDAFESLYKAYRNARRRNLTECSLVCVELNGADLVETGKLLGSKMRNSDYLGTMHDGQLYALLPNTLPQDAIYVQNRFKDLGFDSFVTEAQVD